MRIELSPTATRYLRSLERRRRHADRLEIEAAIRATGAPVTEVVVETQRRFGGYVFYDGLAPMLFGIMHREEAGLEFARPDTVQARQDGDCWFFECFDTLVQVCFEIDLNGVFYEDRKPAAESIGHLVENFAALENLMRSGQWKGMHTPHAPDVEEVKRSGQVSLVRPGSDRYSKIWQGSGYVISERPAGHLIWRRSK